MSRNHLGKQFEKWSFRNQALTTSQSSHQKPLQRVSTRILNIIRKIFMFPIFTISCSGISTFPKNLHFRILNFISACKVFCLKKFISGSTATQPPKCASYSIVSDCRRYEKTVRRFFEKTVRISNCFFDRIFLPASGGLSSRNQTQRDNSNKFKQIRLKKNQFH